MPIQVFVACSNDDLRGIPADLKTSAMLLIATKGFVAISAPSASSRSACLSCVKHWLLTSDRIFELSDMDAGPHEAVIAADLINHALSPDKLGDPELQNTIKTFDVLQEKQSVHPVYPVRDCSSCSTINIGQGWGLRIHCSSFAGIVTKMHLTTKRAAGAYRAIAEWASPLPASNARPFLKAQEAHGRGRTREEAEQGCIGEALERYSLIYRGDERLERGRLEEVDGVDPRDILLYSETQYESRERWNGAADERYFVAERFDPSQEIDWFPGFDLENGSRKLLPAGCVLMWYQFRGGEPEYARADTVGCGSGVTFEDAMAHALLEWIERDAMAIWWYNRVRRPAINIESFRSQDMLDVRDDLRKIGRSLFLLDCTTDFGIPTFISVAPRYDGTELLFAGASHWSPRVAAWKAASEVGQLWFAAVHAQAVDTELKSWLTESLETQPYLLPTHEINAPEEPVPLDSGEQVKAIVDRFRKVGLNTYAADLSRADVLLRTARAVVPGLRHIWNRRAPGRLYDVPVRLGWQESRLPEHQLNPICCMI
ncbi:MAG TPA: YcaO-like family protein [Candidatus Acidoferrales bacterium]|nr:YcaO-like family protein [Candidatus Acidoferrales bacterium]